MDYLINNNWTIQVVQFNANFENKKIIMEKISEKIKVKRVPQRGIYDKESIYKILDKEFICHVGFVHNDIPVVIPTLYGRHENDLYLHGSMASRMMKSLKEGIDISVCVTRVNGLVLARSAFHHSANYESVVVFGKASLVEGKEANLLALEYLTEHVIKGRWEEVRQPSDKELKGTMVLKLPIDQASAKVRKGPPSDDKNDHDLDIWAGVIPFSRTIHEPIPGPLLRGGIEVAESAINYVKESGKK